MRRSRRPDPEPLDVDPVRVVSVGTALWAIALVASLANLGTLRSGGHLWWVPACVAGLLLGFLGVYVTRRRRAAIRRGQAQPAERLPPPLA